ncbi:MAG TPA: glutathione S-transferase family protein [Polyangia bacterium]|jgi:glutathione S-transferase|nr:glutathione S-transferase family protein [Polyangia bacterium]
MAPTPTLLIGNKNYSTWSLRPWLLLRHAGIPFAEKQLSFNNPDFADAVRRLAPPSAGKVPVLIDGDVVVWDSLAIAEYVAETHPDKRLWPAPAAARAHARAVCAEMHSGYADLRGRMRMNCQVRLTNVLFDVTVQREVARMADMWTTCRKNFGAGGPFLFGHFTIADAFFAPVTQRFTGYGVRLPAVAQQYVDTIQALPAMQEWVAAARAETDFVPHDELYREDSSSPG